MDSKHRPYRMCIGCRKARPKDELLRFVKSDEGQAVFDGDCSRGGRGFYLCPAPACFEQAHRNRKTRAAHFRTRDTAREAIVEIQETILKFIEKDLILCKKTGYLGDARDEETPPGESGLVLVAAERSPEEKGEMHTAAHSSQTRIFSLPASLGGPAGCCAAVRKGFPLANRLAMNLQKYEMLSSKGPAL